MVHLSVSSRCNRGCPYSTRPMPAKFSGPAYTLGIEEELMILDGESLTLSNSIETLLDAYGGNGDVKPELMESVLEIAVGPHKDTRAAGAALRALRREV